VSSKQACDSEGLGPTDAINQLDAIDSGPGLLEMSRPVAQVCVRETKTQIVPQSTAGDVQQMSFFLLEI